MTADFRTTAISLSLPTPSSTRKSPQMADLVPQVHQARRPSGHNLRTPHPMAWRVSLGSIFWLPPDSLSVHHQLRCWQQLGSFLLQLHLASLPQGYAIILTFLNFHGAVGTQPSVAAPDMDERIYLELGFSQQVFSGPCWELQSKVSLRNQTQESLIFLKGSIGILPSTRDPTEPGLDPKGLKRQFLFHISGSPLSWLQ